MSKEEMVTIEIPLRIAELAGGGARYTHFFTAACHQALEARKSKYEQWREGRGFPWSVKSFSGTMDVARRTCIRDVDGLISNRANTTMPDIELMAAAPQLLEALIALAKEAGDQPFTTGGSYAAYSDGLKAIRAALPADVANEVLGE